MKYVFKDLLAKGLVYGLGSSFNGLAGFVLIPFFLKHLHAAEYGRYAIAEMLLNILLVVLALGLNVALLARYSKVSTEKRVELVSNLFGLLMLTIVGIELTIILIFWLCGQSIYSSLNTKYLLLVLIIAAIETIWLLFSTLFRAEGAAWRFITASSAQLMCSLLATVWLIVFLGFRDEGILYGRLTGNLIVLAVLFPQIVRYRPRFNYRQSIELLKIGLPLVPATFAMIWILMSPRYFVEWFGNTADVGVFTMSAKIAGIISMLFVQPFSLVWMAALFKIFQRPDAQRIYARVLTYYILVGGAIAFTLGLLAPVMVSVLGKKTFPLSAEIISIMALAYFASGLMYPIIIGPYVCENTRIVLPAFIFSIGISMLLGWSMTRWFGAIGASSALLVTYLVQSMMLAYLNNKIYPIPIEWLRITKILLSLCAAYGSIKLLGLYLTKLALFAPFLFFVFVILLLVFADFFDKYEVGFGKSMMKRLTYRGE